MEIYQYRIQESVVRIQLGILTEIADSEALASPRPLRVS